MVLFLLFLGNKALHIGLFVNLICIKMAIKYSQLGILCSDRRLRLYFILVNRFSYISSKKHISLDVWKGEV